MNLSEPFIRRPVMTILVMLSILFFGIIDYYKLPVSDLPNIDLPTISVSVSYPGANPETMATSIATPLEVEFMTIEGVHHIFSSSNTGSTSIILQFDLDHNINTASTDVQAAISRAQSKLPSDLPNQPVYKKVNPSATPIAYYVLMSPNMDLGELYDYGNTFIGQRISMIEGVSQVITYGSPYAVRIQIDPQKLAAKQIGLNQVVQLIKANNVDLPLGTLFGSKMDYTLESNGKLTKASQYDELIIKNEKGDLVKIKDIGTSIDSVQNDKIFKTYTTEQGSNPCIVLAVQRLPGKNTVEIIQKIDELLKELKDQLPGTLTIEAIYDQSESILASLKEVQFTLLMALILVIGIIYLFLGNIYHTIIPAIALPISIFGSFSILYLLDFSLDILSLLAITLSIGFLIDDAIVVLENNVRHVQMGKKPFDAAIEGSQEISMTILSMTLCLIAAFIPMLFMGGVIGKLFKEFAITIVTTVLISGGVSLSLTAMLSSRLIPPHNEKNISKLEQVADRINETIKQGYLVMLKWSMTHRLFIYVMGGACLIGSFGLIQLLPQDFLPIDDTGFIQGFSQARDGTSPFLMKEYHAKLCETVAKNPNVTSIISVSSSSNPNQGFFFFRLKPHHMRAKLDQVIYEIGKEAQEIVGLNLFLSPLPLLNFTVGTTSKALYQYSLTSIDQTSLFQYAPQLTEQMKRSSSLSQVSSDLINNQPIWKFDILRDKASSYNITAKAIEDYLGWAYSDNKISQINGLINQYNVIIETLPEFYQNPTALSKLYIQSIQGALVPLQELVKTSESVAPMTINHINGLPAVNISFNPKEKGSLGEALQEIDHLTQNLPLEIHGEIVGTAQIFNDSFKTLGALVIIAFFIIYIILGILYESFIHPLTVMSTLPPTLFGALLTLYLFNQPLSIYSLVGLLLLIGIVLKNGIMIVDFANSAVTGDAKKNPYDAIIEACLIRFRPILMTTLAAIMGALPIALEMGGGATQSRAALGLCIVGGLIVSQLLTLFLTPVVYYSFETISHKLHRL